MPGQKVAAYHTHTRHGVDAPRHPNRAHGVDVNSDEVTIGRRGGAYAVHRVDSCYERSPLRRGQSSLILAFEGHGNSSFTLCILVQLSSPRFQQIGLFPQLSFHDMFVPLHLPGLDLQCYCALSS